MKERADDAAAGVASRARGRWALVLTVLLLLFAFVGRAVISSDAAEVISDSLGFLLTGRLSAPSMPQLEPNPAVPPPPPFRSHYGVYPSAFLVPFCALPWAFRDLLGAAGLDAAIAMTWTIGAGLAAWGFLRLARALRPGASPFWAPAFLAGTFLWPYAADSFFETFAAFGLAWAARGVLVPSEERPLKAMLPVAVSVTFAAALKPVLWTMAPVLVAALALREKRRGAGSQQVLALIGLLVGGLAVAIVPNVLVYGVDGNLGYGGEAYQFDTPLFAGLFGLFLSAGRGALLYAPLAVLALIGFRRLSPESKVVCLGLPVVLACIVGRWHCWNGGSVWGPRFLIPVLPLLIAPAVLLPRRATMVAVLLGAAINLPGVLVASGAWITYVETLKPPPGASWPSSGADAVSTESTLSPLYGHGWLLARAAGVALPRPWITLGARETVPPPSAAAFLSPRISRAAVGLPSVPPILPRILFRIGVAGEVRGRRDLALEFLQAAVRLDPSQKTAVELLRQLQEERVLQR